MAAKKHDEQPPKETEAADFVDSNESPEAVGAEQQVELGDEKPARTGNTFKQLLEWTKTHKKLSIPLAVVVLLAVLLALPWTRYGLAGTVWKQDFAVKVLDKETKKPVSSATVILDGKKAVTDNQGKAIIKANAGYASLTVEKKYYKGEKREVVVPILNQKDVQEVSIEATGRQVPVLVLNKISKKPVANVKVAVEGTEAKTDKEGKATLVLPAGKETVEATFSSNGYLTYKQQLTVIESQTTTVEIVPDGWVFFLSNANGKIDVVKTKLDGTERKVVLEGTGKEDKYSTSLLASRDWKYLALHAKRDSEKAKLYLIEAESGKVTVMDEGDANFTLTGWSDHRFIYRVNRDKVQPWENKVQALKSYDADAQKITTLEESRGQGTAASYAHEYFGATYIFDNEVVYLKQWSFSRNMYAPSVPTDGKSHSLNSIKPDGKSKKTIKEYALSATEYSYVEAKPYEAQGLYVLHSLGNSKTIDEYEGGHVKTATDYTENDFYSQPYKTYLVSPSGEKTFWTDFRDGSSVFFLGNKEGENEKRLGALKEFNAYGWYSDDYLLASKKGSELYVLPAAEGLNESSVIKVTDYYKAGYDFSGYGYGYGGL